MKHMWYVLNMALFNCVFVPPCEVGNYMYKAGVSKVNKTTLSFELGRQTILSVHHIKYYMINLTQVSLINHNHHILGMQK